MIYCDCSGRTQSLTKAFGHAVCKQYSCGEKVHWIPGEGDKMRVAICEDEEAQQKLLQNCLMEWAEQNKIMLETKLFPNSECFLFAWEDDRDFDLLILDIEMGNLNGMELASHIRRQDDAVPILFVTGYEQYMPLGYEVSALHYLLKPLNKNKFFQVQDRLREKKPEDRLLFRTERGSISLLLSQIWYVEARAHRCVLYTNDEEYLLSSSIGEMERYLNDHREFIRCHRSYLVNVRHISAIIKPEIILDDKRRLPVSRSAEKEVNRAFIEFYKG